MQHLARNITTSLARNYRSEDGALNTQFVLLAGVGAVIAIALGIILFNAVTEAADSIDMDFEQIGAVWTYWLR